MSVLKIVRFPNSIKDISLVACNTCKEALHSSLNLFPARRQDARSHVTCQDRTKESEEKNWKILLLQKVTGSSTNQSLPSPAQQDLKMLNLIDFVQSQFGSVHIANVFFWLGKARHGSYGGKHFQCKTSFF